MSDTFLAQIVGLAGFYNAVAGLYTWFLFLLLPHRFYLQAIVLNPITPAVVFCVAVACVHWRTLDPLLTAQSPLAQVRAYAAASVLLSTPTLRLADACARALPALALYETLMLSATVGPCSIVLLDPWLLLLHSTAILALFAFYKATEQPNNPNAVHIPPGLITGDSFVAFYAHLRYPNLDATPHTLLCTLYTARCTHALAGVWNPADTADPHWYIHLPSVCALVIASKRRGLRLSPELVKQITIHAIVS